MGVIRGFQVTSGCMPSKNGKTGKMCISVKSLAKGLNWNTVRFQEKCCEDGWLEKAYDKKWGVTFKKSQSSAVFTIKGKRGFDKANKEMEELRRGYAIKRGDEAKPNKDYNTRGFCNDQPVVCLEAADSLLSDCPEWPDKSADFRKYLKACSEAGKPLDADEYSYKTYETKKLKEMADTPTEEILTTQEVPVVEAPDTPQPPIQKEPVEVPPTTCEHRALLPSHSPEDVITLVKTLKGCKEVWIRDQEENLRLVKENEKLKSGSHNKSSEWFITRIEEVEKERDTLIEEKRRRCLQDQWKTGYAWRMSLPDMATIHAWGLKEKGAISSHITAFLEKRPELKCYVKKVLQNFKVTPNGINTYHWKLIEEIRRDNGLHSEHADYSFQNYGLVTPTVQKNKEV